MHSLAALTLLQQPQFRADIMNPAVAQEILNDVVASLNPEADPGQSQIDEKPPQQNGN